MDSIGLIHIYVLHFLYGRMTTASILFPIANINTILFILLETIIIYIVIACIHKENDCYTYR